MKTNHEFFVDILDQDTVSGWGWYPARANERMRLSVSTSHETFEVSANRFRKDVKAAGHGDGSYGFSFDPRGPNGEPALSITIKDSHGTIVFKNSSQIIEAPYNFDITDVLVYLKHHSHPSGIQRVQLAVAKELIRNTDFHKSVSFVAYYSGNFCRLPDSFMQDLIDAYDRKSGAIMQKLAERMFNELNSCEPLNYQSPLLLISMGASWIFDDYYENLYRIKSNNPIKTVQIVYDLIPINQPQHCTSELAEAFQNSLNQLIRGNDQIIAISQHTAQEVARYALSNEAEIPFPISIPMGSDPIAVAPLAPPVSLRSFSDVQFVLFVSTVESRKNHRLAMDIWRELYKEMGEATPILVFAGRRGWRIDDFFDQLNALKWLNGKIRHLDTLGDTEIAWLYENSLFTLFPSLNEGWGLPVTESLAYGKPCIASNADSIPEAGGGFASHLDPHDLAGWVAECRRMIIDNNYREGISNNIKENYVPFLWKDYSERLMQELVRIQERADVNRSFLNIATDHIYKINKGAQESYRRNYLTLGNPLFGISSSEWHDPEDHGLWSRFQEASMTLRVPDARRSALAVKVKFPGQRGTVQLLLSVANTQAHSFTITAGGPPQWLYMEMPEISSAEFVLTITAPTLSLYATDTDGRGIGFGIEEFCVLSNSSMDPATRLSLLLSNVSFATS